MANITLEGILGAADDVTHSFLSQTYPAIAQAVSTPLYFIAIIYWVILGYKVYAGYESVRWSEILARLFTTTAVFSALSWSGWAQSIYIFFTSLMEGAASTIMAGQSTTSMLDALWHTMGAISSRLLEVRIFELGKILQGYGLLFLNCILFLMALVNMTIAKFGLAITMILLPIFLSFFFFEYTRQWAINWMSQMLHFCFLYILVIAIVRFGFTVFSDTLEEANKVLYKSEKEEINVSQVAYLYIIEGVLIVFMLYARGWALTLASGISVQGGAILKQVKQVFTKGVR